MKRSRRFLTLLTSVIVLAVLASVSLAGPGSFGRANGQRDDMVVTDDGEGCDDETTDEGDETTDEGDECDVDATDDGGDETDEGEGPQETDEDPVDVQREAACLDAAGIERSEEDPDEDGDATKAHGLDNAIEHVLANCVKNPQAPGLLNALERLAANRERHEAHDEWKAEKEAAKDARKANKHAGTQGHGKGHGGAGGHGNPHDGGSHGNGHH